MNNEIKQSSGLPDKVEMSTKPAHIDLTDVSIIANQCTDNSIKVSQKYGDIEIIEGILVVAEENYDTNCFAHTWNRFDDIHFDITNELVWKNDKKFDVAKEYIYMPVFSFLVGEIASSDYLKYSKIRLKLIDDLKTHLSNKSTK